MAFASCHSLWDRVANKSATSWQLTRLRPSTGKLRGNVSKNMDLGHNGYSRLVNCDMPRLCTQGCTDPEGTHNIQLHRQTDRQTDNIIVQIGHYVLHTAVRSEAKNSKLANNLSAMFMRDVLRFKKTLCRIA